MKWKWSLVLSVLAVLTMVVTACDVTGTPDLETRPTRENTLPVQPTENPEVDRPAVSGLEGINWILTGYLNREGEFATPLPDKAATARFEGGKVSGTTGCNNYFANYELDGEDLTTDAAGMTEMYCFPDELMAQEADYLVALSQVATWSVEGGELKLTDEDGDVVLAFSEQQPEALVGTTWLLVSLYDGQGGVRSLLAGTEITAVLGEDGRLAGSAGCNSYFTTVEIAGNEITLLGPVGSTMMACMEPEGIMDQETAFLATLENVASYEIEGRSLTLFDAGGEPVLTFAAVEPTPLVDTPWQVIAYNNGRGGVTSILLGTELTATFGADGRVTGSTGCNNYFVSYELDGESVSIGQAGMTERYCQEPEGIMDQEAEFLAALQSAATYSIQGDRLQLRDADGALQVDLIRAEASGTE